MLGFALAILIAHAVDPPPPLTDLQRFPSLVICREAITFNRAYHDHASAARQFYPHTGTWHAQHPERQFLDRALYETDNLFYVWDCLSWAQDASRTEESRRFWLGRLRLTLGRDAYAVGAMPPAVPVWLFRRID